MKFECDSCGANYKIADEKVSGKGVKVKCKRCGHVIIVRPSDAQAQDAGDNADDEFGGTHADLDLPGDLAGGFDGDADKTTGDGPLFTDSEDAGAFGEMTLAQNQIPATAQEPDAAFDLPAEDLVKTVSKEDGDLVAAASSDGERPPWEDDDSDATAFGDQDRAGADLGSPFGDEAPADDADAFATPAADAGDADIPDPSDEEAFMRSVGADNDELPLNDEDEGAFGAFDDSDTVAAGQRPAGLAQTDLNANVPAESAGVFTDEQPGAAAAADTILADQVAGAEVPAPDAFDEPPAPDAFDEPPAPDAFDEPPAPDAFDEPPAPEGALAADLPDSPTMGAADGIADPMAAMPDAGGSAGADDMALPDPDAPAGADGLDAQLEGAFSSMFGELPDHDPSEPVPEPAPFDDPFSPDAAPNPTALLDMDQMDQLRADASPTGEGQAFGEPAPAAEESDGWHAAIDDEDHGPMRYSELEGHVRSGAIDPETLVWRTGMSDWLPAGDVSEVSALFSGIPMPSLGGLDVGAPIDDLSPSPFGGPEQSDPFAQTPDAPNADPNWQPHGLTEVYAAANLAEAAGAGAAGGGLGMAAVGLSPAPSAPSADAGGWTPGAASALESLVNDEIARIDTPAPSAPAGAMPPAAEGSLLAAAGISVDAAAPGAETASLPSNFDTPPGTGGLSGAVPPTGGDAFSGAYAPSGAAPFPAQSQSMPYAPPGGQSMPYGASASMAFAPPMQQKPQRSPLFYAAAGGGMLILLLLTIGILKMAFFPSTQAAVAAVPPEAAPTKVAANTQEPATKTPPKDEAVKAAPAESAPNGTVPPTGDKAEDKAASDTAKAPEAEKGATGEKPADSEDAKVASASAASVKAKPEPKKKTSRTRSKKKDPPKKRVARSDPPKKKKDPPKRRRSSGGGCDILDPDCDASGGSRAKKTKKTLSKADILGVVKKNISRVNRCGRKHNGTGSTVKVKWQISKTGKTKSVSVQTSAHKSSPLGKCLIGEVKRWRFPKFSSSKSVPVSFPFKLK